MAIDEERLRTILEARGFFAAAQASYRRLEVNDEKLVQLRQKKRLSKLDKELLAILDDSPPYLLIQEKVLPSLLYNADRWEQMTDAYVQERRPYLRYVGDACQHPEHTEKHGVLYPSEHEFWLTWLR